MQFAVALRSNSLAALRSPSGKTKDEYLRELCQKGIAAATAGQRRKFKRLEYELAVIKKMGFVSYFLIVWDFIHYAKQRGIPLGRGAVQRRGAW